MKLLFLVVAVLAVIAMAYLIVLALRRIGSTRQRDWVVDQKTLPDNTMQVVVRRGEQECRVVKELPAAMDPIDFRVELDAAMDQARTEVRELNQRR